MRHIGEDTSAFELDDVEHRALGIGHDREAARLDVHRSVEHGAAAVGAAVREDAGVPLDGSLAWGQTNWQSFGAATVSGEARDCNDHKTCTDDACDETTGCSHTPTPTCDACDGQECVVCGDECDVAHDLCEGGCWNAFFACLNGCTTTYCAPFCQVDLGRCIAACPAAADCRNECETGNGCTAGCAAPF